MISKKVVSYLPLLLILSPAAFAKHSITLIGDTFPNAKGKCIEKIVSVDPGDKPDQPDESGKGLSLDQFGRFAKGEKSQHKYVIRRTSKTHIGQTLIENPNIDVLTLYSNEYLPDDEAVKDYAKRELGGNPKYFDYTIEFRPRSADDRSIFPAEDKGRLCKESGIRAVHSPAEAVPLNSKSGRALTREYDAGR